MFRFNFFKKKYKKSYSQCGEDMIVDYIFRLRGIKFPSYIDIGASDPYHLSNTAYFYQKGCKGINIEPNTLLFERLKKKRSKDLNLNFGIGAKSDVLNFYIFKDHTLSTFSSSEYERLIKLGSEIRVISKVELRSLPQIIETFSRGKFPDFMSLDIEGFEFEILNTLDFELSYPKVICVESAEYSPNGTGNRRSDIIDFLTSKGYYEYANTNLNAIMVHKKFWFN